MSGASTEDDVDPRTLLQLRELQSAADPRLLADLIDSFLARAPELLEQLHQEMARGGLREVERAAHRLLNLCGSLGLTRMVRHCSRLQDVARRGRQVEAVAHLTALSMAFDAAREKLMAERAKEEPSP